MTDDVATPQGGPLPISEFRLQLRRVARVVRLCAADDELASHELLIVQLADGPLGLVDALHLYERKALGTLGRSMRDDLGAGHAADPVEQLGQIVFGGLEGEIADVEARGGDLDNFGFRRGSRRGRNGGGAAAVRIGPGGFCFRSA